MSKAFDVNCPLFNKIHRALNFWPAHDNIRYTTVMSSIYLVHLTYGHPRHPRHPGHPGHPGHPVPPVILWPSRQSDVYELLIEPGDRCPSIPSLVSIPFEVQIGTRTVELLLMQVGGSWYMPMRLLESAIFARSCVQALTRNTRHTARFSIVARIVARIVSKTIHARSVHCHDGHGQAPAGDLRAQRPSARPLRVAARARRVARHRPHHTPS